MDPERSSKSVVIFRCDRIGDVLNTLPLADLCKRTWPESRVLWVTSEYAQEAASLGDSIDEVWVLKGKVLRGPQLQEESLAQFFGSRTFHHIFLVKANWRVFWAAWKYQPQARRVGPLSSWASWAFLNQGVRQGRSSGSLHEAEYNQKLFPETPNCGLRPRVRLPDISLSNPPEPGILWHPLCGQSALYLPPEAMVDMLREARVVDIPLYFAGSSPEFPDIQRLAVQVDGLGRIRAKAVKISSLSEYAVWMRHHLLWVGPSTGPLHLASAMDIPVMTYFSPIQVQHPRRWGPYGHEGEYSSVWLPPHACPGKHRCLKRRCPHFGADLPEACLHELNQGEWIEQVFRTAETIRRQRKRA